MSFCSREANNQSTHCWAEKQTSYFRSRIKGEKTKLNTEHVCAAVPERSVKINELIIANWKTNKTVQSLTQMQRHQFYIRIDNAYTAAENYLANESAQNDNQVGKPTFLIEISREKKKKKKVTCAVLCAQRFFYLSIINNDHKTAYINKI